MTLQKVLDLLEGVGHGEGYFRVGPVAHRRNGDVTIRLFRHDKDLGRISGSPEELHRLLSLLFGLSR